MEKFVALYDVHWGYMRKGGHKVASHDPKAVSVAMQFLEDFKPDHVVLGGDILDCRAISHHVKGKPGQIEGLRLISDAKECRQELIEPIEKLVGKKGRLIYHIGNHEDWLNELVDELPGLEDIVSAEALLGLNKWEVIPQGKHSQIGKLKFIHGDQIKGGVNMAINACTAYESNIRMGHFHTFQTATKTTPVDANGHTGIVVPCLCKKDQIYGQGMPNKWMQGFLWGYVNGPNGIFNDYVTVIVNGQAIINGKVYKG